MSSESNFPALIIYSSYFFITEAVPVSKAQRKEGRTIRKYWTSFICFSHRTSCAVATLASLQVKESVYLYGNATGFSWGQTHFYITVVLHCEAQSALYRRSLIRLHWTNYILNFPITATCVQGGWDEGFLLFILSLLLLARGFVTGFLLCVIYIIPCPLLSLCFHCRIIVVSCLSTTTLPTMNTQVFVSYPHRSKDRIFLQTFTVKFRATSIRR